MISICSFEAKYSPTLHATSKVRRTAKIEFRWPTTIRRQRDRLLSNSRTLMIVLKLTRRVWRDNLPSLTDGYTALLLHYLQRKHTIDQESYWFPRLSKHKQWFFAGDTATSMALQTSSQQPLIEETPDHQWLENEIVDEIDRPC